MESLQIRTGQVRLQILDDQGNERGIFTFNPEDVEDAKRALDLREEFDAKVKDFEERSAHCETNAEKMDLLSEVVRYFRGLVDQCYGEGSSQLLFGEAKTLSMFKDFFDGIMPYYQKASDARISKYKKEKSGK